VKRDIGPWRNLLATKLARRERRLPRAELEAHVRRVLEQREAFLESVSRFGSPQYFFDQPGLHRQIERFHAAFGEHIPQYRAFYAMKSNDFEGICHQVVKAGMGIDASSGRELATALRSGSTRIVFSGPGKTDEELALALRHRDRVTLHLDSHGELRRLLDLLKDGKPARKPVAVGVRVHGPISGRWDKFGIPLKELPAMLRRIEKATGMEAAGIQFHTSWNLDPSAQTRMIDEIGACIRGRALESPWSSLRFLDIGGGFWPEQGEWLNAENTEKGKLLAALRPDVRLPRVRYRRRARPIAFFAREIAEALRRQGAPLSGLELWVEPGRWLSTPAMHVLLRAVDKKDRRTVILDGGINILGWERPLTEFIPLVNLSRPSVREVNVNVFGSLCTPDDVWGTALFGEGIERGDVVAVPDQGAYTYSLRQTFIKPVPPVVQFDGMRFRSA
jgi:diaminopimelate decarboxylase